MDAIMENGSDGHAIKVADMYVTNNIKWHVRKTIKGWQLCIRWKDGTTSWERLADLKESYPIEVAEYSVA